MKKLKEKNGTSTCMHGLIEPCNNDIEKKLTSWKQFALKKGIKTERERLALCSRQRVNLPLKCVVDPIYFGWQKDDGEDVSFIANRKCKDKGVW